MPKTGNKVKSEGWVFILFNRKKDKNMNKIPIKEKQISIYKRKSKLRFESSVKS